MDALVREGKVRLKGQSAYSADHFEKIVPAGKEAVVRVRPQQPGRYTFFDDFHRETKGALVVP